MTLTQNSVFLDQYSTSINVMSVQTKSGVAYINLMGSSGVEVVSLPSPICIDVCRGENNDPISKKSD